MDPANTKVFGKAEARLLDEWYRTTLGDLLQIDLKEQQRRRPKVFVMSELYMAMNEIASDEATPDGRVYVYFGRPFSGKTSAGRALLEKAASKFPIKRGLFVTAEKDVPLISSLSKLVGAPDTGDLEWVTTLFDALAGKKGISSLHALRSSFFAPFSACGLGLPVAPRIISEAGTEAPIVVFDNVADLKPGDGRLTEKVYQLAQSTRVNVFVLTDNRKTANDLCRMNGRQRIKPLPRCFTGNPTGEDDVEWREDAWLVPTLSRLVFKVYPSILDSKEHVDIVDGSDCANFVSDGDLPAVALTRASKINSVLSGRQRADIALGDREQLGFV
jgi:hypothetical protein